MKLQLFHIWASAPVLLSLVLLLFPPRGLTLPQHPAAYLPTLNSPDWADALLQLQAWLGDPAAGELGPWAPGVELRPWAPGVELRPWAPGVELPARPQGVETQPGWEATATLRGQREELGHRHLGPFPQHPIEEVHYQQGGEIDDVGGEKRNEALTSIAGGLQSFNRQKGGFGFRFGKK
ncbi:uncharacterized protein qrfp [Brachyhypopomus gauderio]|uniref:uncharacterized protein qrfp n=1 Tax=Brachyhypopomus gauderio TaxID=698409 RepID=UPI00404245DD